MKYLVVGLGNIGPEYELTRHNVGFLVLDQLAGDKAFKSDRYASYAEVKFKGRGLHLIKPSTFMNLSGKAVRYWMQELKIPIENVIIVTDDINLSFGKMRMKPKGSNGGHNGLGNIEELLQTSKYPRLRFGVGSEYEKGSQINYVLGKFSDDEFKDLNDHLKKACEAIKSFCSIGIDRTMNQFNN